MAVLIFCRCFHFLIFCAVAFVFCLFCVFVFMFYGVWGGGCLSDLSGSCWVLVWLFLLSFGR